MHPRISLSESVPLSVRRSIRWFVLSRFHKKTWKTDNFYNINVTGGIQSFLNDSSYLYKRVCQSVSPSGIHKKGNKYFQLLRGCIRQTIHPLVSQSIDMSVTACHASDEFQYNSAFFGLFQHEAFWDTSSHIYIQFICSPVHPFVMLASLPNISPHTILRLN